MQNIFLNSKGKAVNFLTLSKVAVVPGFYCNIVLEAKLFEGTKVWYCRLDLTLRKGPVGNSKIVGKLICKSNVCVLEYKPISSCYSLSYILEIPLVIIYSKYPHSRTTHKLRYLIPRTDSTEIWHLCSGHLRSVALKKLVSNTQNIQIQEIPIIKCKYCTISKATKVVNRIPSENKAKQLAFRMI